MSRSKVVSALLVGFALGGCGSPSHPEASGKAGRALDPDAVLLHEGYSGFSSSQRLVVRDAATWAGAWATAYALQTHVPPVPEVDFSKELVVVAALGARPSGGYDIEVEGVQPDAGGARVFVAATAPGDDCVTTAAITQPVVAVRVSAVNGAIEFQERMQTLSCK